MVDIQPHRPVVGRTSMGPPAAHGQRLPSNQTIQRLSITDVRCFQ